jgi:hypothetical protein
MNENLKGDLNEAKGHAKEAARATLLAMRKGIDFAIDKLGGEDEAKGAGEPGGSEPPPAQEAASTAPEGSITSPATPGGERPGDA